ncbi:hypothetical protein AS9A_3977 [Hoyosella subflava DQS3-9A1]|uniref:Uncharacterized protein n=1 Tax=Hoyosella subflava (strain DSM 45089 / JCM 17490 / NBRC 109087 / DQS3-9A1) TaxID=443218 RepID=F6EHP9_HOYSD|nr:hypothetical protein AS9A_3977 [Hoyosella subflava DQS3-9A1]
MLVGQTVTNSNSPLACESTAIGSNPGWADGQWKRHQA